MPNDEGTARQITDFVALLNSIDAPRHWGPQDYADHINGKDRGMTPIHPVHKWLEQQKALIDADDKILKELIHNPEYARGKPLSDEQKVVMDAELKRLGIISGAEDLLLCILDNSAGTWCKNPVSPDDPDQEMCAEHLSEHIIKLTQDLYEASKELCRYLEVRT